MGGHRRDVAVSACRLLFNHDVVCSFPSWNKFSPGLIKWPRGGKLVSISLSFTASKGSGFSLMLLDWLFSYCCSLFPEVLVCCPLKSWYRQIQSVQASSSHRSGWTVRPEIQLFLLLESIWILRKQNPDCCGRWAFLFRRKACMSRVPVSRPFQRKWLWTTASASDLVSVINSQDECRLLTWTWLFSSSMFRPSPPWHSCGCLGRLLYPFSGTVCKYIYQFCFSYFRGVLLPPVHFLSLLGCFGDGAHVAHSVCSSSCK